MPCVCLVNTFAYRKTLKARQAAEVKTPSPQPPLAPTLISTPHQAQPITLAHMAANGQLADGDDIRIPHSQPKSEYPLSQSTEAVSEKPTSEHAESPSEPIPRPIIASRPSVRMTRADLINAESKLGSTIFGPIPEGHRREFFHDQQNIWIWHEDWTDGQRTQHQMTVRYEVRTSGVYKKVSTGKYFKLEGEELENFRRATRAYLYVIKKYLYNRTTAPLSGVKKRRSFRSN